tara:strand:- start:420 stop:689 length:270 start_codon:yes stop_codon:yes gene_type:complete
MLSIKTKSKERYEVVVNSESKTTHVVTISDKDYLDLTNKKVTKEELLKFSFNFLLERESNTSILSSFELRLISKYFPEYENSVKNWCKS